MGLLLGQSLKGHGNIWRQAEEEKCVNRGSGRMITCTENSLAKQRNEDIGVDDCIAYWQNGF